MSSSRGDVMKALIRIFTAVLILLLLAVGVSYGQSPARESYVRGVEYAAEGKFEEARSEFGNALRIDKFDSAARESLKVVEDAISHKIKKETAVHIFKGTVYGNKGMQDEEVAEYNKAIELNPGYSRVYNNRGIVYHEKGLYDLSIADFNKAIKLNPKYVEAYYNRGVAYDDKGRYDIAIADYSRALELDPRYSDAYYNRGVVYAKIKGQFDLAIADFNKAIELVPGDANVYVNRAICYYYKREYDKTWKDVHKAESLGEQVHQGFLKALREASGRQQ